ncbi:MAG: hypothetical protein ACOYOK_04800 [Pseudobdellovibrionaceae bacterium]
MRNLNINGVKADVKMHLVPASSSYVEDVPLKTFSKHREILDKSIPGASSDLVQQMHSNLLALEEVQSRFEFVLREVRYQLKI